MRTPFHETRSQDLARPCEVGERLSTMWAKAQDHVLQSSRRCGAELDARGDVEQSSRLCEGKLQTMRSRALDHLKRAKPRTMWGRAFNHMEQSLRSCRAEFEAMWSRAPQDAEQSGAELETMWSRARDRVEQSSRLCRAELQNMWKTPASTKRMGAARRRPSRRQGTPQWASTRSLWRLQRGEAC